MAAKPPAKPPGNFLKQLNDCLNSGNNTTSKIFNKLSAHLKKNETDNNSTTSESSCSGSSNSIASFNNTNDNCNINGIGIINNDSVSFLPTTSKTNAETTTTTTEKNKSICNCTNISIMHLFHEMKQEFPTIPDTIVAQCVNENCHQRENCIQQLRNELALHPIPVQTYPAKVLHPPINQQQHQQQSQRQLSCVGCTSKSSLTSNKSTTTSLKPSRPAPVQPPSLKTEIKNCDSVNNNNNNYNININNKNLSGNLSVKSPGYMRKNVQNIREETTTSDMPITTFNNNNNQNNCFTETRANENRENVNPNNIQNAVLPPPPTLAPRMRPTTLNLPQQQQQQQQNQRQQINIQLQKHFQQRQQQQQQQQTKPLRKAPLPPIPPKPTQYINAGAHSPQFHHSNSNNNNNNITTNNNINGNHIFANSQQSSFSNDSNLTSPTSSLGESSEISVNVSLSSPIVSTPPPPPPPSSLSSLHSKAANSNASLRSPIRHRSVITVHPEPPYTRDFASTTSPTTSVASTNSTSGPKSFTSVNLTLRQPNTNSAVPASTIDISAGPGLSGNGSGLTYSSTSYDARLGFQKNFHITVTDEGGVFSASRIRPRSCFIPETEHEHDGPNSPTSGGHVNKLRTATSEQCVSPQPQQKHQQQEKENILAGLNNTTEEMCVPKSNNALNETLERQKSRRDKLATALRDNKKRLNQVQQEVNVLAEPVRPDETERLDEEIQKLRSDCEAMLNEIDIARRSGPSLPNVNNNNRQQLQQQLQPQPFPRQRSQRTTPTTGNLTPTFINRQPELGFIQHHNTPTTPYLSTTSITNSPHQQAPPPTYQEYYQHRQQQQQQQQQQLHDDDEDFSDSITDADDDDDQDDPLEIQMWACNMCTFRNHPQLNICECCDYVRIQPGTLQRMMPIGVATAVNATSNSTTNNNASDNNDANLTQQQLQQFALPT